jgi:hypothetical protein
MIQTGDPVVILPLGKCGVVVDWLIWPPGRVMVAIPDEKAGATSYIGRDFLWNELEPLPPPVPYEAGQTILIGDDEALIESIDHEGMAVIRHRKKLPRSRTPIIARRRVPIWWLRLESIWCFFYF